MRRLAPWFLLFLILIALCRGPGGVYAYNTRNLSRTPRSQIVMNGNASLR